MKKKAYHTILIYETCMIIIFFHNSKKFLKLPKKPKKQLYVWAGGKAVVFYNYIQWSIAGLTFLFLASDIEIFLGKID